MQFLVDEKKAREKGERFQARTILPNNDPRDHFGDDETLLLDHHLESVNVEKAGEQTLGLLLHALKGINL